MCQSGTSVTNKLQVLEPFNEIRNSVDIAMAVLKVWSIHSSQIEKKDRKKNDFVIRTDFSFVHQKYTLFLIKLNSLRLKTEMLIQLLFIRGFVTGCYHHNHLHCFFASLYFRQSISHFNNLNGISCSIFPCKFQHFCAVQQLKPTSHCYVEQLIPLNRNRIQIISIWIFYQNSFQCNFTENCKLVKMFMNGIWLFDQIKFD